MKIFLVILFMLFSYYDQNKDLKLWVKLDFAINSRKIVNNDSINYYFSFYTNGHKMKLENKIPIDILSIDSIIVQSNKVKFKVDKYINYIKDSSIIKSFDGDTLDFECYFYNDFKKSSGYLGTIYEGTLPDSLNFYGLILFNVHIYKEYH